MKLNKIYWNCEIEEFILFLKANIRIYTNKHANSYLNNFMLHVEILVK